MYVHRSILPAVFVAHNINGDCSRSIWRNASAGPPACTIEFDVEAIVLSAICVFLWLSLLSYERVVIFDELGVIANLKMQLKTHNDTKFSSAEFSKILNRLDKRNVFERAKVLRDWFNLIRDDGTAYCVEFLNVDRWSP